MVRIKEEWPITIEHCLESAIRSVQNNYSDEDRFKESQTNLLYLCCGIVAGIKSQQKETDDGND